MCDVCMSAPCRCSEPCGCERGLCCGFCECCPARPKPRTWTGEAIRETLGWLLFGLMLGGTAFYLLLLWFSGNNY